MCIESTKKVDNFWALGEIIIYSPWERMRSNSTSVISHLSQTRIDLTSILNWIITNFLKLFDQQIDYIVQYVDVFRTEKLKLAEIWLGQML